jgi:hypothetical protein
MNTRVINTEKFERDSLATFEMLLQGYRRANQSSAWVSNMDELVDKLTHLPSDPFSVKLMELFNYNYLVLSESIDSIIEKALVLREQMKCTQRFVEVHEKYFSFPFFTPNTYLKRLEVFNHEGELCYLLVGRLQINPLKLFKWLMPGNRGLLFQNTFTFKQKSIQYQKLEIHYYSPFLDLSTTDRGSYYDFFCDYYGKVHLTNYLTTKDKVNTATDTLLKQSPQALERILNLSSSQQVLWGYFLFRLIGLQLRVNAEVAMLTRFLLIVNRTNLEDYKNSYFYKLVSKAPYVKEDNKLLVDLETIKLHFQQSNLPTGDIENEILKLITK